MLTSPGVSVSTTDISISYQSGGSFITTSHIHSGAISNVSYASSGIDAMNTIQGSYNYNPTEFVINNDWNKMIIKNPDGTTTTLKIECGCSIAFEYQEEIPADPLTAYARAMSMIGG